MSFLVTCCCIHTPVIAPFALTMITQLICPCQRAEQPSTCHSSTNAGIITAVYPNSTDARGVLGIDLFVQSTNVRWVKGLYRVIPFLCWRGSAAKRAACTLPANTNSLLHSSAAWQELCSKGHVTANRHALEPAVFKIGVWYAFIVHYRLTLLSSLELTYG